MAFSFKQSNANNGLSDPASLAFDSNVTAGSLLICAVYCDTGRTITGVSDDKNGAWTAIGSAQTGAGSLAGFRTQMFYFAGAAAGATIVSVDFSGAPTSGAMAIHEFGVSGTASVDGTPAYNNTNSSTPTSSSVTSSQAGDLGFCTVITIGTISSAGTGYTLGLSSGDKTAFDDNDTEYNLDVGAAGSKTASMNLSAAADNIVGFVLFKEAAAGATALAFDAAAESHTGTTGSASQASFDTTLTPVGTCKGVLVFTFVNANANDATSVKINPAGANVDVPAVTGGRAVDTAGEPGDCKAWFLGSGIPTGSLTIRVNRTNNADVMYAVCISITAQNDTYIVGTPVLLQEDGTCAEQSVDSGIVYAIRFAGNNSGLAAIVDNPGTPGTNNLSRGASSTEVHNIDFGTRVIQVVRETTGGTGSRSVGFSASTSDDRAAVHLAVAQRMAPPFISKPRDRLRLITR